MAEFHLLVGSMLGGTEYVAEIIEEKLQENGHTVMFQSEFERMPSLSTHNWIVISSSHGAGELPDNIQPFSDWLATQPNLSQIRYGLIAIGDSCYDTFCSAGKTLDQQLTQCHAQRQGERLEIDVQKDPIPEDVAIPWIIEWSTHYFPVDN